MLIRHFDQRSKVRVMAKNPLNHKVKTLQEEVAQLKMDVEQLGQAQVALSQLLHFILDGLQVDAPPSQIEVATQDELNRTELP